MPSGQFYGGFAEGMRSSAQGRRADEALALERSFGERRLTLQEKQLEASQQEQETSQQKQVEETIIKANKKGIDIALERAKQALLLRESAKTENARSAATNMAARHIALAASTAKKLGEQYHVPGYTPSEVQMEGQTIMGMPSTAAQAETAGRIEGEKEAAKVGAIVGAATPETSELLGIKPDEYSSYPAYSPSLEREITVWEKKNDPGKRVMQDEQGKLVTAPSDALKMTPAQIAGARSEVFPLQKKTITEMEGKVFNARAARGRLAQMRQNFRPEYMEVLFRGKQATTAFLEKFGREPSADEKAELDAYTKNMSDSLDNINTNIKEMTGAQMSKDEAKRLRKPLPDPSEGWWPEQSATQFMANLQATDDRLKAIEMRSYRALQAGLITEKDIKDKTAGDKLAGMVSIDSMLTEYERRGDEIFEEEKAKELDDSKAGLATKQRLIEEFGQ